jgi:hypothetical protein
MRCHDDRGRRAALRATDLNGIDYLEIDETDRHRLTVYFIGKLRGLGDRLTSANFVITGGRRVPHVRVTAVAVCEQRDRIWTIASRWRWIVGDFSAYTLCIVGAEMDGRQDVASRIDPIYACVDFVSTGCPSRRIASADGLPRRCATGH